MPLRQGTPSYDPATGRFLSQDPIAFGAGDSNLYRYVGNSPVNFTDPSGLEYVDPLVTAKPADLLTLKKRAIQELGLLQAAQGGVESYAGIAAIRTGYGAPVGVLALGHGLDQGYAGIRQAITGERCVTQFERGLKAMGVPARFAPAANAMLGAGLTGACSVHVLMPRISGQIGQGEGALGSVRPTNNAAQMLRNLSTSDFGEDAVFLNGRAAPGPSAIVKCASGEAQAMDFMAQAGRRGGQVYGEARVQTLGGYLERRGITLRVGDEFVPVGKGGAFSAETGELLLRSNPTRYEVWHELGHFRQYQQLGKEAYLGLARPRVPEQFVFDILENSTRRWGMLTVEEQQHAIWTVQKAGGFR